MIIITRRKGLIAELEALLLECYKEQQADFSQQKKLLSCYLIALQISPVRALRLGSLNPNNQFIG